MVAAIILLGIAGLAFALSLAASGSAAQRDRLTERALAQAREALIAYAADRPISAEVGPGYLPCPDLDDDGWAESTCGSMTGDSGQAQRLGRLPWKTLGLPDLRDGEGERLWYAVSSKYKGLLNCAVSRACLDMSPDAALGTISVRDRSGTLLNDGTVAEAYRANEGGAVAVVIAPGAPLTRVHADASDGAVQRRDCAPGDCDLLGRCTTDPPQRAAHCDPANFLDNAPAIGFPGEDNADFVDRNDTAGRGRNRNGFIHGPVVLEGGRVAVNDRLAVISYRDVMPRIMARVALEVARCLRDYAARPENAGRFPWPAPVCAQGAADPAAAWRGEPGALFGRIPDTPFGEAGARHMLDRWWRSAARSPEDRARRRGGSAQRASTRARGRGRDRRAFGKRVVDAMEALRLLRARALLRTRRARIPGLRGRDAMHRDRRSFRRNDREGEVLRRARRRSAARARRDAAKPCRLRHRGCAQLARGIERPPSGGLVVRARPRRAAVRGRVQSRRRGGRRERLQRCRHRIPVAPRAPSPSSR